MRATPGGVVQCGGAGEGYTRRCGSVRGAGEGATPGGVFKCGGAGEGYTGWYGSLWWCR